MTAVVGVALLASLGLLPWLGVSMFADEGATLYSAHLSWSNLWAQSQHVDLVLLPYYVLIHFWLMISGSIEWVRALSLLAYFGTVVTVGFLGLRIAGRWCGVITAVLSATSTLLVEKSLNARPYELSTLLVALCAVVLCKWLDDCRTRWSWMFSVLALLATAMQLFSLLAPVSMLVCVLVVRPKLIRQRLRVLLAPLALLALASGAWVFASVGEVAQVNWIANESTETRLLAEVRGPVIGQVYDLVILLIVALALFKLAAVLGNGYRDAVVDRLSKDRDILALTFGWALVPALLLSVASFAHPIFADRYVSASAPGAALLAALICVRTFPRILDRRRASDHPTKGGLPSRLMATLGVAATVVLVVAYVGSASAQQEDLQGPARFVAQHARNGDVIALPDHAITSAVEYYLAGSKRSLPLWPQLGVGQRYVEGFDLSLHTSGGSPRRVWVVEDGSVPGVTHFEKVLLKSGYGGRSYTQFNGAAVLLFIVDSALPTTAVLVPSNGATVSGKKVILDASVVYHGVPFTRLQFVLSGGPYSKTVIGTAPYTHFGAAIVWDSTGVPNGTYELQTLVTSKGGNSTYSPAITIKVHN
jgi:hypothetical protein